MLCKRRPQPPRRRRHHPQPGRRKDLYGRKRRVADGALLTAVGSVVFAVAPSVQAVWAGAAINGLGAEAVFPGTLALVATSTHTATARARAIAIWSGCLAAGAGLSPLLGGRLASDGSWRWSLWVLVGLAVAAFSRDAGLLRGVRGGVHVAGRLGSGRDLVADRHVVPGRAAGGLGSRRGRRSRVASGAVARRPRAVPWPRMYR